MKNFRKLFKKLKSVDFSLVVLVLIIVIAVLVRFWNLPDLFHFTLDEEYWLYMPFNVATGYHLSLIGGPIGGTGMYLGPLFVWLMGVVFFFLGSNPLLIAAFVSLLGVIGVFLVTKLFEKSHGRKVSLLAGLLIAASTLVTLYDRKYWNASLGTFLGIISLALAYRIKKTKSIKLVIALGCVASLAIHAHMTGLALVVFGAVAIMLQSKNWKYLLTYLVIVVVSHAPLVAFDLRHDFVNTKAFLAVFQSETEVAETAQPIKVENILNLVVGTSGRLLHTPAQDVADELTLCRAYADNRQRPPIIYFFLGGGVLMYGAWLLKDKRLESVLLAVNLGLMVLYAVISSENFYPGQLSEYYLLPSFAAFFLIFADGLILLSKRVPYLVYTLISFLVVVNLHTTFNLEHSHSYAKKIASVQDSLRLVDGRPFSLEVKGDECQIYGYRYLYSWLGHEPVSSYLDNSMLWLYQDRLPMEEAEVKVVIDADSGTINLNEFEDKIN